MILDVLLLISLATCVAYCIILTKRINELNANKASLASMLSKFNESISKADSSVDILNQTSDKITKSLAELINKGEALSNDLTVINGIAENTVTKIEKAHLFNQTSSQNNSLPNSNISQTLGSIVDNKLNRISAVDHENNIDYGINQVFSPKAVNKEKQTLDQNQYFNSLKKINTKNEA
jgi:hypothetical protein